MKYLALIALIFCAASHAEDASMLTPENFTAIKKHILAKGDRETFCNMYNHNPHIELGGLDCYLLPETGQANINCDPAKSDFDTFVIRTNDLKYLHVTLTKKGALTFVEHYKNTSQEALKARATEFFNRALAAIKK